MPDPAFDILSPLAVPDTIKARAWEDFNGSASSEDFQKRFEAMDLPDDAKAKLWEVKYGQGAQSQPSAPKPSLGPAPMPKAPVPAMLVNRTASNVPPTMKPEEPEAFGPPPDSGKSVARGVGDLWRNTTDPEFRKSYEAARGGTVAGPLNDIIEGGLGIASGTPFFPKTIGTIGGVAAGVPVGMLASRAAQFLAKQAGASPEQERLAENVGGLAGGVAAGGITGGLLEGAKRPRVEAPRNFTRAKPSPLAPPPPPPAAEVQARQRAAKAAKENVQVPETGIPEEQARAIDARERIAKQLDTVPEDPTVEGLVKEGYVGAGGAQPSTKPVSAKRARTQKGAVTVEKPKPGPEDEYLNFGRMGLSGAEEQNLRGTVLGMMKSGRLPDPKDVEPIAAISQQAAQILGPDLVRYISAGQPFQEGLAGRAARAAIFDRVNTLTTEITSNWKKLGAHETLKPEEADALRARNEALDYDLKQYIGKAFGIRQEAGRNLSALRRIAQTTSDLTTWLARAKQSLKLPPTASVPDQHRIPLMDLTSKMREAEAAGDVKAAQAAQQKLTEYVNKLDEDGWAEMIKSTRNVGLTLNLPTHATNIVSNTLFATMEEAARGIGALVDGALSLRTGHRAVAWDAKGLVNSLGDMATKGFRSAGEVMKQGATSADLAKGDIPRELNFQGLRNLAEKQPSELLRNVLGTSNDFINAYNHYGWRTLAAEDRVFKAFSFRRSLEELAKVEALNAKRKNPRVNVEDLQRQLAASPSDGMTAEAAAYAEYATFNNKNLWAQGFNAAERAVETHAPSGVGKALTFASGTIVPFRNTPGNLVGKFTLDMSAGEGGKRGKVIPNYNPLTSGAQGMWYAAKAVIKGSGLPEGEQEIASRAIGRGLVGWAMMYLGWKQAEHGSAVGMSREEPDLQNTMTAAGRNKGTVKVGDGWTKISNISPFGNLHMIGATAQRESSKGLRDEGKRSYNLAGIAANQALELPMFRSTADLIDAMRQPAEKSQRFVSSYAGSFIPGYMQGAAILKDPTRRESAAPSGASLGETMAHGMKYRTPGLRETLPEARDVFGNALPSSRMDAISPFYRTPAREDSDPLHRQTMKDEFGIQSVKRGTVALPELVAQLAKDIGEDIPLQKESDPEYRARKAMIGSLIERELRAVIDTLPESKPERIKAMKKAVAKARAEARAQAGHIAKLPPEQRVQEMEELAASYRYQ